MICQGFSSKIGNIFSQFPDRKRGQKTIPGFLTPFPLNISIVFALALLPAHLIIHLAAIRHAVSEHLFIRLSGFFKVIVDGLFHIL